MCKKPIIIRTVVLIFLTGLLLVLVGNTSAQTYWDAIFELGFDSVNQRVNPAAACDRLEKIFHLNTLVSDHLLIDKKLRSRIHDLHSGIRSRDAKELYSDLPDPVAGSLWRGIEVRGQSNPDNYQLYLAKPEIEKGLKSATRLHPGISDHQNHFGDMNLRVLIRPTQTNTFRFVTQGQLYLDDLPAQNLARVLNGMLQTLGDQASHSNDPPVDFLENASLNRPSRKLLYGIGRDFPNFFKLVRQYVKIDNVVSANFEHMDDSVTVDLRGQFNRDAFVTNYPELAKFLDKFDGMVLFRTQVLDEQGRQMGTFDLDSQRNFANIQFRTFDGRLLPMGSNSHPEAPGDFSLTDKGRNQFQVVSDIHISVIGLHFDIKGLQTLLEYSNSGNRLHLKARLKQSPQAIAVSGRLFGWLPVWLVDLLIASNVEKITTRFFNTLAKSNHGQGAEIELGSLRQRAYKNSIWLRTDAEIISNGTLKLGFNFQRALSVDLHEVLTQIRVFRKQLWDAFYQDYRFRVACLRPPSTNYSRQADFKCSAL